MTQATLTTARTLHQMALGAGFLQTIPVMPPGCELHEYSRVDPKMRGKVPGDFYSGKWDGMGGWPDYQMDAIKAERWDRLGANVGLKMGYQWVGLDIDCTDAIFAQQMRNKLIELGVVTAPIRVGAAPKFMLLFAVNGEPIVRRQYGMHWTGPVVEGGKPPKRQLIEVLGVTSTGGPSQGVIFGTHPDGMEYTWDREIHAGMVPSCDQQQMDHVIKSLLTLADGRQWAPGTPTNGGDSDGTGSELGPMAADPALVTEVVACMDNKELEYDDWCRVAYGIKAACGDEAATAFNLFMDWSGRATKHDMKFAVHTWNGLKPRGDVGFGTLVHIARADRGGMLPIELEGRIRSGGRMQNILSKMPPIESLVLPNGAIPIGNVATGLPDPAQLGENTRNADVIAGVGVQANDGSERFIPYVLDTKGGTIACFANVHAYLVNPTIWKDCFAFDAFRGESVVIKPLPGDFSKGGDGRPMDDDDYHNVRGFFQRNLWNRIGKADIMDAVDLASKDYTFEPVQDYLKGCPAPVPGLNLLDNWLVRYCGVEAITPEQATYVSAVGRKWLVSAVERAMVPGSQVDHTLIMEGAQGVGKSTVLRALCPDPEWFGDCIPDFHENQKVGEYLNGKWIVEMSELASLRKSDVEDMRRFLTRRVEEFRPAYGRKKVYRPRRCVFSGTTNSNDYLKDGNGERRFWITKVVRALDVQGIVEVRDLLWGEAHAAWQAGERLFLEGDVAAFAKREQQDRVVSDPWIEMVEQAVGEMKEVAIEQVMNIMGLEPNQRNQSNKQRIARALGQVGFVKRGHFYTTSNGLRNLGRYVRQP